MYPHLQAGNILEIKKERKKKKKNRPLFLRLYLWWSLCTLYLHACRQVRVTVRQLRSLLLYMCDVDRVLIISPVCWLNILKNPLFVSPMQFPPYHCEIPWRHLILFITDSLFGDWCIHPSMRHSQEPSLSVSLVQFNFGLSLSATPEAVFKDISFILFWETEYVHVCDDSLRTPSVSLNRAFLCPSLSNTLEAAFTGWMIRHWVTATVSVTILSLCLSLSLSVSLLSLSLSFSLSQSLSLSQPRPPLSHSLSPFPPSLWLNTHKRFVLTDG